MRDEREFFRSLVGFADHDSLSGLLNAALALLVTRFAARETFLEVMRDDGNAPPIVAAHGCDESRQQQISAFVSRGIISEAIATGETVVTANALADTRFMDRESVQRHQLEAVLCVPIGRDVPIGIVYLQGTRDRETTCTFDERVQRGVELVARALALPIERLLVRGGATPATLSPRPAAADGAPADDSFRAVLGRSPAIIETIAHLRLAAPLDVSILLTGPSGAGKTLLANAIHLASRRCRGPFVELNCATLPEALLENELFGADPGAHSAVPKGGVRGKVEAAQGGTLFLDEIAELALGAQAKLLQLLQSRTYYRLGGTEPRHADVRVIAATNVNLRAAVAERRFREDFYYRLQVLEARIPALAERPEDLLPLAVAFLRQAVDKHQLSRKVLSPGAMRGIQAAEWPGNVRELAHRIESAAIHAHLRGSDRIELLDVFPDDAAATTSEVETLQGATRRFQRQHISVVLRSTEWNVLETARVLDVSRSHVYNLIRTFGLKLD
jgi:transcriptional regulator with GAF, ATPase, and Fis domain